MKIAGTKTAGQSHKTLARAQVMCVGLLFFAAFFYPLGLEGCTGARKQVDPLEMGHRSNSSTLHTYVRQNPKIDGRQIHFGESELGFK